MESNRTWQVWNGVEEPLIDQIQVFKNIAVTAGVFGGSGRSGAVKNEDGYIIAELDDHTVFACMIDAHTSYDGVALLQETVMGKSNEIERICKRSVDQAVPELEAFLVSILTGVEFQDACSRLAGEAAVLFCLQKDAYLWWLSVGDNSLYVFHPEYMELGQAKVNQRIFYQWVGKANSLALPVPCYASATMQLRGGKNQIVLLTDGVLEIEGAPFEDFQTLHDCLRKEDEKAVRKVLEIVKERRGRDNATIVTWSCMGENDALRPTR